MEFSKILINWYLKSKRNLPWRETQNPYNIWLSEIMLQQTRIAQGLPYYEAFLDEFQTVFDLAKAPQDKVMKLWQGLGYYSRARNLHETAKYIAFECDGEFPKSYKELLKLKGVGDYTASAIASISYNEPVAVVDGNVFRVLARYFDVNTPINSSTGKKEFKELAAELLDKNQPSLFNQGIMEFGALQCKPKNPLCDTCPFNSSCLALKKRKVSELPVKIKKGKIKNRYFNYLIFLSEDNKTLLQQREGKGIWHGLYQFPLIETKKDIAEAELIEKETDFQQLVGEIDTSVNLYNDKPVVHKLSHQHIFARFWLVPVNKLPAKGISVEKVQDYPVPVLIQNFITEIELENL